MKQTMHLLCALLLAVGLAPIAGADAIVSPVEIAGVLFLRALPWILVVALVVLTVILILRFKKRK